MSSWVALKVQTGQERIVAHNLEERIKYLGLTDKIEKVFAAVKKIGIISTKNIIYESMLPGYILVKCVLTDALWYTFKSVDGVYYVLGNVLDEESVRKITSYCTNEAEIKIKDVNTVEILKNKFKELIVEKRSNRVVYRLPLEIVRDLVNKAQGIINGSISDKKLTRLMLDTVQLVS